MPDTDMVNLYFCLVAKNSKVIQKEEDSYGKPDMGREREKKSEADYYFFVTMIEGNFSLFPEWIKGEYWFPPFEKQNPPRKVKIDFDNMNEFSEFIYFIIRLTKFINIFYKLMC